MQYITCTIIYLECSLTEFGLYAYANMLRKLLTEKHDTVVNNPRCVLVI